MATTPSNLPRDDPSLPSVTCADTTSTCTGRCNNERERSSNTTAQSDGGGNDEPMNDIDKDQKQERPTPIHETCTKAEGHHQPQNPPPQQQQSEQNPSFQISMLQQLSKCTSIPRTALLVLVADQFSSFCNYDQLLANAIDFH